MSASRVILIVDDLDEVGSVASEYLERRVPSVQVYETTNPKEALEWLKTAPQVDLILSDNKMGEMDGITFLSHARRLQPRAALALMTAYLDLPISPQELGSRGILGLVKKPWQWSDFAVFVLDLLTLSAEARGRLIVNGPLQLPEGAFAELGGQRS